MRKERHFVAAVVVKGMIFFGMSEAIPNPPPAMTLESVVEEIIVVDDMSFLDANELRDRVRNASDHAREAVWKTLLPFLDALKKHRGAVRRVIETALNQLQINQLHHTLHREQWVILSDEK